MSLRLLTLLVCLPAAAHAAPAIYTVDAGRSLVYVRISRDESTLLAAMSHDHVVRADTLRGSFAYDPSDLGACRAEVVAPVSALIVDEPSLRRRAGLEGGPSEDDRKEIREHMLAEDQLYAERHREVRFRAEACVPGDRPGTVVAAGVVSLRGVERSVEVQLAVATEGDSLRATGKLPLRHTDFGFEPYSAALGAVKNKDEMTLVIDLVGVSQRR